MRCIDQGVKTDVIEETYKFVVLSAVVHACVSSRYFEFQLADLQCNQQVLLSRARLPSNVYTTTSACTPTRKW